MQWKLANDDLDLRKRETQRECEWGKERDRKRERDGMQKWIKKKRDRWLFKLSQF